ncbi:MAG TPA: alanine--tRNA ligase [Candidatus Paceibacterota bacterium]|nr:alanine--tRNA ligase [Candidatus Paceibacterota bacterium]
MTSNEIRKRFLAFFEKRGHAVLPSAPLVPENDPSVLFNTAGMQPLVPYLLGQEHPQGRRLADAQKCVRTVDIDEIGDNTHATFFEMLGNWSLGDPSAPDGIGEGYFKKEAIAWSFEFLTSREEGLGLDPKRLYVTVFEGDENAPKDTESFEIWKQFVPENRIYFMSAKSNWWSPGDNGPSGPDTEMFYDVTENGLGDLTKEEYMAADDRQDVVEIWNDVFMEYEKKDGKVIGKLKQKNVDTGAGLERVSMVVNGKKTIFDVDFFVSIREKIQALGNFERTKENEKAERIVADHMRTATFLIADGVEPSNRDQGYVLRRLLRRSIRFADALHLPAGKLQEIVQTVSEMYREQYPNLEDFESIAGVVQKEEEKFRRTLKDGLKQFEKLSADGISGEDAFNLYQSFGFPIEMTEDLAREKNISIDRESFDHAFREHQDKSRKGAEQKFHGGLADHSEMSVKYHTATHLLHQALRDVLGEHVFQKGSNITKERLRFDFSHPDKMSDEEKKRVEDLVNEKITAALPVFYEDIPLEEAKKRGAIGLFEEKYGDKVRVYQIGEADGKYSLEFCGGPHVKNTSELGHFKIKKEEASSAGVRRIKAVLE